MNELGKSFLQSWEEFKNAVLEKITPPRPCEDPVVIVMKNAGSLFTLDKDQVDKVILLGTIHKLIEDRMGADEAISAALTEESLAILKQIVESVK